MSDSTVTTRKRGWKKPILERARQILNGRLLGAPIEGDDDRFLRDLIALHPEAEAKIGCGVERFEVRGNEWNGRTFWLIRHDGTATDFSFIKALSPPSAFQDFAKACREAVVDQVIRFKTDALEGPGQVCPITGEPITRANAHVDHSPPWTFDVLVRAFAEGRDLAAEVEPTRDGDLRTYFRDPATREAFAGFHAERARLRIVSRWANLSVLRTTGADDTCIPASEPLRAVMRRIQADAAEEDQ